MKKFLYAIIQQAVREVLTKDVYAYIDTRFDAVDKRFDAIDKRMDAFEVRLKSLAEDVANIKGNLEGEARAFHIAGFLKKNSGFVD
jgi:hypothetical protein